MKAKKLAFLAAGGLILLSLLVPYLYIIFTSPQYPAQSPKMYLYTYALKGDLQQWEVVGRYIGIKVPPDLPEFDNHIIVTIIVMLATMALISAFLNRKWKKVASILLIVGGIALASWAQYRLYQQGHNLDPNAPMRYVVKPFTPPLIGVSKVSKIKIYHLPHLGFLLFFVATGLSAYAAWYR